MNLPCRIILSAVLCLTASAATAQTVTFVQTASQPAAPVKVDQNQYFPFTVDDAGLTAKVNIREARIVQFYAPLFFKYQYAGTVQTWEDMIEELLAQQDLDFSIRNKIAVDEDKDHIVYTATSKHELAYFLKLVQPTFSVISSLEAFVKKVDPRHIYDGSHRYEEY